MKDQIRVGLVYGSTRPGRFCDKIAQWAAARIAARNEFAIEIIDPAAAQSDKHLASMQTRLGQCDAFVIVTPEYNHGYPAPLKSLIDLFGAEWHFKPVAFVSYGGVSGGLRAVEQLRLVFAELHAVTVRDSVSFAGAWEQFDSAGVLFHPERAERSMNLMLSTLVWWAVALRNARAAEPYGKTA